MTRRNQHRYILPIGIISLVILPALLLYRVETDPNAIPKTSMEVYSQSDETFREIQKGFNYHPLVERSFHFSQSPDSFALVFDQLHKYCDSLHLAHERKTRFFTVTFSRECKHGDFVKVFDFLNWYDTLFISFRTQIVGKELLLSHAYYDPSEHKTPLITHSYVAES